MDVKCFLQKQGKKLGLLVVILFIVIVLIPKTKASEYEIIKVVPLVINVIITQLLLCRLQSCSGSP